MMRTASLLLLLHAAAAMGDKFPKPHAVLFDFDGSLAQSEEAHRKRFVAATGVKCDSARWDAECVGRNTEWIVCHLLGVDEPPADVVADLAERVVSDAFLDDIEPTSGGLELLSAFQDAAVPCAIVTSGLRAYVEACLERWGVKIDFIVAGDDDVKHKPAPEPYLAACEHFGVAPADCVAVEDSPSGLQSALSAGCVVIAIRNPANDGLELLDDCRAVADDLVDRAPFGLVAQATMVQGLLASVYGAVMAFGVCALSSVLLLMGVVAFQAVVSA